MSQFYGDNFVQGRDVRAYDPRTGWIIRRPWRGTPSQMVLLRAQLQFQGIRFEDEPGIEGGYETVWGLFGAEESQPEDQEMTNSWDLIGNDLEKDIWWHPKVKAMFDELLEPPNHPDGVPTDTYVQLKKDIDDLVAGNKVVSELAWWPDAFPTTKKFVRTLLRGVTVFSVSQYVLRNTKIVAANYSLKPALTNVGRILTTAQVSTTYAVPTTIKFVLPEGYWHERTPQIQEGPSNGKFTITREWWHADEYDDFLYDPI